MKANAFFVFPGIGVLAVWGLRVTRAAENDSRDRKAAPQIEAYAKIWERIVGQPVAERVLFFTHFGEYVET